MNTLSEIEEYYKAREQQLLKKLHQQGAALAAAEQALKQLTENQKVSEDETARQRAAREQAFEEKLYRDPLTGIYNRRYYEEVARKTIGPAGVALMDVDDFKICNDTYGHYAGDMALKTVANTIQSCIRKSDLLIRYGGDEFLLVLPGIPGDFLQTKLEQICTAAQMASVPGYSHFRLSLSIGGTIQAIIDPMENAVRRADRLMYQAKGRKNAVMVEVPGHDLAALEKLLQNKPQILLVDDSAMNRMILTEILGDSYHILEAENGRECMEKLQAEAGNIALVLLDINLPDGNGFELCKLIKPQHPDTIVIFLTANDQESDQIRGYEVGAVDYITKPFVIGALQRKIKAMFAMLEHHKPAKDIYDDGRLFLDFSEQTASLNGKPLTLSPMEYKMLNLFRKNPRQVLTRGQLLEKLWDIDERFVDEHTLTTSISRIRSKIESDGGAPYIKTVYGMGYQWTGGEAK